MSNRLEQEHVGFSHGASLAYGRQKKKKTGKILPSVLSLLASEMRLACGVEYDGTAYYGWQRQTSDGLPTIQETLEQAIAKVANHPVTITAAGRTDAGVHATGQVIHFDTTAQRSLYAWQQGVNTYLPPDIALTWVRQVPDDFHARYSATARRYHYLIYNSPRRSALLHRRAARITPLLNAEKMQQAAQVLIGEHDFSAFRAAGCQARSPQRCVEYIRVTRHGSFVITEIQANAFLHHMVRNIMGVLIPVGSGEKSGEWVAEVLQSRCRSQAGVTAPACGLYLAGVEYGSVGSN